MALATQSQPIVQFPTVPTEYPKTTTIWQKFVQTLQLWQNDTQPIVKQTAAEQTAGVTPTNYTFPPGHVQRYGADPTGVADSATAINNAATVGGPVYIPGNSTFLIASRINTAVANTRVYGDGPSSIIQCAITNIHQINCTATGCIFENFKINVTAVGTTANIAGIVLNSGSGQCRIDNVDFAGLNWAGIWIHASNNNTVTRCYMHGWASGVQDTAGVYVDAGAAENVISYNDIYGNAVINSVAITFTAGLSAGATSGTLNASWPNNTGTYQVVFSDAEIRNVSLTHLATTATWSTGLTNNVTSSATVNYGATGMEHGIILIDPAGTNNPPVKNIVSSNRINQTSGYGVAVYMANNFDNYNQVVSNYCEGVLGVGPSSNPNTSSGNGIYIVGAGAGGVNVLGNTVRNCCINTAATSLAPAAIGLNQPGVGNTNPMPIVVDGNTIEGMTQYHGVLVTGNTAGVEVTANVVRQPAANTTGDAIRIANGTNVGVNGNTVFQLATTNQRCIFFFATGAALKNCTCEGNIVNGGHLSQIECQQTGGSLNSNIIITGNICTGGDASCTPLLLNNISATNINVSGNNLSATTQPAITQTACTDVTYTNNIVASTGTIILNFTGANTGSLYDKSNIGSGTGAGVNNAGTGLIVEQYGAGAAAPAAGTWAKGDTIRRSDPAAAGVLENICTTAGTGGGTAVFKTISNT